jgi:O-6-methylguanine DNA methyltransferase
MRGLSNLEVETGDGFFNAFYSSSGLAALQFPTTNRLPETQVSPQIRAWHTLTVSAVRALLAGEPEKGLPPFDLSDHTVFRRKVWAQMRQLRRGETVSYGELACRVGSPGGARAIGNACGANPIPLLIPCHRVLGANSALGGFSGGIDWKVRLLAREGIHFQEAVSSRAFASYAGVGWPSRWLF